MTKKRKIINPPVPEETFEVDPGIVAYMEEYFAKIEKYRPEGDSWVAYYKSSRGFFKYSNRLPEDKFKYFKLMDYKLWEWILKTIKSTREPALSGGLHFRFSKVSHFCSSPSFYRSRAKFLDLGLLLDTPFKDYYILNPDFIIKLYNPKTSKRKK